MPVATVGRALNARRFSWTDRRHKAPLAEIFALTFDPLVRSAQGDQSKCVAAVRVIPLVKIKAQLPELLGLIEEKPNAGSVASSASVHECVHVAVVNRTKFALTKEDQCGDHPLMELRRHRRVAPLRQLHQWRVVRGAISVGSYRACAVLFGCQPDSLIPKCLDELFELVLGPIVTIRVPVAEISFRYLLNNGENDVIS